MILTNCMWCDSNELIPFKGYENRHDGNQVCQDCGMIQFKRCFRLIGEPNE